MTLDELIAQALKEDIGDGDHTTLATVPENKTGKVKMLAKQDGIISGIEVVKKVYGKLDPETKINVKIKDGEKVKYGDVIMTIEGKSRTLLTGERLALNFIQRMSGIATYTNKLVKKIEDTGAVLLDTRKTTPCNRIVEKMAVKDGGAENHRFGLFDMIMIKDNHVDFAGGIKEAILAVKKYLSKKNKNLKIELEIRNFDELDEALKTGGIHRLMLDNFKPDEIKKALTLINGKYETEASGGITEENIREYAKTGVDYISVGALTHQIKSLDISIVTL